VGKVGNCVIVSNLKSSSLDLTAELAEKKKDLKVILLSDAVFMLKNPNLNKIIRKTRDAGASIYVLSNDIKKRGIEMTQGINVVNYDELVDLLLTSCDGTINF
jgi:sulfur relay protein TusB/DsrH